MPGGVAAAVLIAATGIGWGLLAPASKVLFAGDPGAFDGLTLAVARAVWSLPLFAAGAVIAWRLQRPRLTKRTWAAIAGASVLFGPGMTLLYSDATQLTSVAHISFLIGFTPVSNSLLAALVFRLPLGPRQIAALVLGVFGVALLAVQHAGEAGALAGDLLMVVWLAAFASYAVLLRAIGPDVSAAFTMCAVGVLSMGLLVGVALAHPAAFRGATHVAETPLMAAWFFGAVVLGSAFISQIAYVEAVRRFGVAFATIGGEYTAVAVGVAASLFGREPWTWQTAAGGGALVLALAVTIAPLPLRAAQTAGRRA